MSTKKITTVGMLCAMAMIVNVFISFPIVPAVSFLRYDPKDILIVIGGFIYGPMTSLLMSFICSIFEIMLKGGNILDVLMNMVSTCSFACMAAFVYKKVHNQKGAILGLVLGVQQYLCLFGIISLHLFIMECQEVLLYQCCFQEYYLLI